MRTDASTSPARASASSTQSRPSLQSARTIQNSRRALPSRREASVSPCERLQSKAARKLSSSAWSRSSHAFWSGPRSSGSARSAKARLHARWRSRRPASSPSCRSRSSAYSRIVSSIAKRGSSSEPSSLTRLLSISDARPSSTSRSPPQTRSAASSVQPPANTARRAKSLRRVSLEEAVTPVERRPESLVPLRPITRASGQEVESLVEPREQRGRRQQDDTRCGELDRKR